MTARLPWALAALSAAVAAVWALSWATAAIPPAPAGPAAATTALLPVPTFPGPAPIPPSLLRTAAPIPPGRAVVLTAVPYIDRGPR